LDEALQIVDTTGERWLAAKLNRRKGQLLLQGDTDAAEERYGQAVSITAEQQARLWELRAALSLARLRCDQGWPAQARDLLVPAYTWFTKGFNPPTSRRQRRCSANSVPSPLDFSSISSAIKLRIWHAPSKKSRGKGMAASYPPWPLAGRMGKVAMGHQERFPPPGPSGGCGFQSGPLLPAIRPCKLLG
jgi:hypothetical protein